MVYKRGNVWWVDISLNGKRVQRSAKTKMKTEAIEFHDRLKADLWRQSVFEEKPRRSWQEAAERWIREHESKKSLKEDLRRFVLLDAWLVDTYLDEITRDLVDKIKWDRAAQNKVLSPSERVSRAEVNRLLALLRSVLNAARDEWEWIEKAPKIKLFPEAPVTPRWINKREAKLLIEQLPSHLVAVVRMALASGLREQNILKLKWQNIDLARRVAWITGDETKNAKSLAVPLNEEAMSVLRSQRSKHTEFVFTYQGRPIKRANTSAWRKALHRAGIKNFRFHDLRHTWASWHIQAGTPIHILQELGGWQSTEMVRRYAHLAPDDLAIAAANNFMSRDKPVTVNGSSMKLS